MQHKLKITIMKKKLLLCCVFLSTFALNAQNNVHNPKYLAKKPDFKGFVEPQTSQGKPWKKPNLNNKVVNNCVTTKTLGSAGNAYGGFTRPGRPVIDYNPTLNTITLIHRSNPTVDGSSNTGNLFYDVSKDGGNTWMTNVGPIYVPGSELARYPMAVIYNPVGNTNPSNAYISYHAAATNGSGWVAHLNGASQLTTPVSYQQNVELYGSSGFNGLIPDAGCVTNEGTFWVVDWTYDGTDYTDTILIKKGVFNTVLGRHDFTTTKLYFPVTYDATNGKYFVTTNIAFAPNGLTGYVTAIANDDLTFAPDSSTYLVVWKTIDGGTTWTGPTRININNAANSELGTSGQAYNCAFQLDGVVDSLNRLHLILGIAPKADGTAIYTTPGTWGEFSVITDGGNNTSIKLLAKPMTFRGTFGSISDDSRGQLAMNPSGSRIYYVWFDTDTTLFPGNGNTFPNAYMRSYNVSNNTWSSQVYNLTGGSSVDAIITFGYVAQYTASCGANDKIIIGWQTLSGADTDPVDFQFASIDLCCLINSVEEIAGINNLKMYPNPAKNNLNIEFNSTSSQTVNIDIFNNLGQLVYTSRENVNAGRNIINMNISTLTPGIYTIKISDNKTNMVNKLIIE